MVSVVTVVTSCSFDVEWQDAQHSSEIIIRPQTAQRVCWLICTPCVLPCHPALRAPLQRRGMGCLRAPHCGSALCGVNCTACVFSLRDCLRKVFNKIIIISSLLSHLMLTSYSHHTSHITHHTSHITRHTSQHHHHGILRRLAHAFRKGDGVFVAFFGDGGFFGSAEDGGFAGFHRFFGACEGVGGGNGLIFRD